jgi:uncharacterized protein (DUF2345 family)
MNIYVGTTNTKEGAEVTETIYIGKNVSKKSVTVKASYNGDDNHCSRNSNIIESATNFLIESGLNIQGPDGPQVPLSTILLVGNNCGSTGIDLNNNNIENVNTISSNTALTLSSSIGNLDITSHGDINLTSNTGKINAHSDIILKDTNDPTWIATLEVGGLSFNIDDVNKISIDADGGNIQVNGHSGYSSLTSSTLTLNDNGNETTINPNSITTHGGDLTLTNTNHSIILDSADNINLTAKGAGSINLTAFGNSGSDIYLNARNGSLTMSSALGVSIGSSHNININSNNEDITLNAYDRGIFLNAGLGEAGIANDITLTTTSGTLTGNIILNSAGAVQLDAQNSFMSLNALNDITIQSTGAGKILLNSHNMNSYGYALPICLNYFAKSTDYGTWSYTLGGQQFQDVFAGNAITIALPPQFFADAPQSGYISTRWQINFDMNCWNFANAGDKGFACYLSFIDNNSNLYEPFLYNSQTPYCKLDNHSSFTNQNSPNYSQFKSIHFCDYIDFGILEGSFDSNIRLQMFIAGDNQFNNVDFNFKLGFTRIHRV